MNDLIKLCIRLYSVRIEDLKVGEMYYWISVRMIPNTPLRILEVRKDGTLRVRLEGDILSFDMGNPRVYSWLKIESASHLGLK